MTMLMSQRPSFWLHRSSRFWRGLVLLLLLLGCWIYTSLDGAQVGRWTHRTGNLMSFLLSADRGGLGISYHLNTEMGGLPSGTSKGGWYFRSYSRGAKLAPSFEWMSRHRGRYPEKTYELFVPLWIPLGLWVVLWPLWMHRADKKEDLVFGQGAVAEE